MKKFQRFLDKKEKDEIKNGIKEEIKRLYIIIERLLTVTIKL